MKRAFTIIRVSKADQLKGYGPDIQWLDDVLLNAPALGLEVDEGLKRVIQESATGWDRERFQEAVREALQLYQQGHVQVLLFPRVDRETRFIFGSFPLLVEVVRTGMEVCFAQERLRLNPEDPEAIERYLSKAQEAQAYVATLTRNTARARYRRATRDHKMPTGGEKYAHHYEKATGQYSVKPLEASWVRKWRDWLLLEGVSLNECCRRMKKVNGQNWYPATMVKILEDPAMIGRFYAYRHQTIRDSRGRQRIRVPEEKWVLVYEDASQAVLSEQDFHVLKEQFSRNRENAPRNTKYLYPPLRKMVRCGGCNRVMVAVTTNRGTAYYRCPLCRRHINAKRLWSEIRGGLSEMMLAPERLIPAVKHYMDAGGHIASLEAELASKQAQLEHWRNAEDKAERMHLAIRGHTLEKLLDRLAEIGRMKEQIEKGLEDISRELQEARQLTLDQQGIAHFCRQAAQNLDTMTDAQWRLLLERMHFTVIVEGDITVRVKLPAVGNDIALSPCRRFRDRFPLPSSGPECAGSDRSPCGSR